MMSVSILRIFNAYGPSQHLPVSHAPVVPRFVQAALSGGSVVIFGNGQNSRDFIYISDVVEALVKAATAEKVNRKVLNIGSGRETTVEELIAAIERISGRRANRVWNREKSGGVDRLVADIGLAQKLIGFEPRITLDAGLDQLLAQDPRFSSSI